MAEGLLIKGYNGFYYVESDDILWSCSLRGKFRIKKQTFLPGDRVRFTVVDAEKAKGVIEEVYERKNSLLRPPVANVERVIITLAVANPKPDLVLLDRILLQVMDCQILPVICFNKCDLLSEEESEALVNPYRKAGFPVVLVSAKKEIGLESLREEMKGHLVVMAGPSGVGKSTLLNHLHPDFSLQTGELSKKVERGKHTTRKVELFPLGDGTYIADTPGFSNLFLPEALKKNTLIDYYPEFQEYRDLCPYKSCMHLKERDCAVKDGVENGSLDRGRYERYCIFLEELTEKEGNYQ